MEPLPLPDFTYLRSGKNWIRTDPRQIMFFEALGDYVRWTPCDRNELPSTPTPLLECSLQLITQQLEAYGFLRVHRKYTVNMEWVRLFDGESVHLSTRVLPVGKTRRKQVLHFVQSRQLGQNDQTVGLTQPTNPVRSSRQ